DNDFTSDAVEGLQQFKDQSRIQFVVEQLNRSLKKKTASRKVYKEKWQVKTEPWLLIGIVIILILIVLSYVIIHNILQQS
ncbi:MAG: hypothetical protein M3342_22415, partial [Bacteroidota bacterium]|nr:hypothetical protein [Bacteroidota bacterium]